MDVGIKRLELSLFSQGLNYLYIIYVVYNVYYNIVIYNIMYSCVIIL